MEKVNQLVVELIMVFHSIKVKRLMYIEELHNRQAQQWLSYLDEVLLPRVDYGRNRGSFICNISLLTNTHHTLLRLGDVTRLNF